MSIFDFTKLIEPVEPELFFEDYWEQKPLLVDGREPDFFKTLFQQKTLDHLLYFSQPGPGEVKLFKGSEVRGQHRALSLNQIYSLYSQGFSVVFNGLDRRHQPLLNLAAEVEKRISHPVGINMYLTPKGSRALNPHYDIHDVMVLQIEGRKRWCLYDKARDLPLQDDLVAIDSSNMPPKIMELEMRPGDLLYLPRGFVHEAWSEETYSLHLSLGIRGVRWHELVRNLLNDLSDRDIRFRRFIPVGFMNGNDEGPFAANYLKELLEAMLSRANYPGTLAPLRELFTKRRPHLTEGHFEHVHEASDLSLETVVQLREGIQCRMVRSGSFVLLYFSGNMVRLPAETEPALVQLMTADPLQVGSLSDDLSDQSKCVLARRLIGEGLLILCQ